MNTYLVEVFDLGETYFGYVHADSLDEAFMNASSDPLYVDPFVVSIKKI